MPWWQGRHHQRILRWWESRPRWRCCRWYRLCECSNCCCRQYIGCWTNPPPDRTACLAARLYRAAIARETEPWFRQRSKCAARIHLAHYLVQKIGDINVARRIHRYAIGRIEARRWWPTRHRRNIAPCRSRERWQFSGTLRHFADPIVGAIGDIDIARRIECHRDGRIQFGNGGGDPSPKIR